MSYCTSGDVQALNSQIVFTSISHPNQNEINSIISQIAGIIDARLSAVGFTVPVGTGYSVASGMLLTLNAIGAAALVENSRRLAVSTAEGEPPNRYWTIFNQQLSAIEKNPQILNDAPRASWSQGATSYAVDNPDDDDDAGLQVEEHLKPKFRKGQVF